MKFLFFPVALMILLTSCGTAGGKGERADIHTSSDTAVIEFAEYEHDFGQIFAGEKVATIFKFTNTGKAPLILNRVTTSCGCTVTRYSTKPVAPGESGTIEVVFDSGGYNGMQKKTVTVMSNASQPYVFLQIKADVISDKNN